MCVRAIASDASSLSRPPGVCARAIVVMLALSRLPGVCVRAIVVMLAL